MRKFFLIFAVLILSANLSLAEDVNTTTTTGQTTNKKIIMAEKNPIAATACKAYKFINGGIAKALITLLFVITGIGFFIGKISWGIVISLIIGTSLTLTSGKLVGVFVGDAGKGGGSGDICECKYGLENDCKQPFND